MTRFDKDSPLRFIILFLALFAAFYYFNIFFSVSPLPVIIIALF